MGEKHWEIGTNGHGHWGLKSQGGDFVKPANLHLRASLCLPFPSHSISSIFLLFSVIRHHCRRRNSLVGEV
jgi:hypothetical protein